MSAQPLFVNAARFGSNGFSRYRFLSVPSPQTRRLPTRLHTTKAVLRPNIAIVGGGHAGISVALRLASLPWTRLTRPQITLVDKAERFCFLPMLYELALDQVNQWEIAPKFDDLLQATSVKFLQGNVENLDVKNGMIEGTTRGANSTSAFQVPFDRAVLALGAETAAIDSVSGAAEFALPFYRLEDALRLKHQLTTLKETKTPGQVINIVVVGGGFSGVEIASCLADDLQSRASVLIVETGDRILKNGSSFNRQTSEQVLMQNEVVIEYRSRVTQVSNDAVTIQRRTADASQTFTYPADLVIWTAGAKPSSTLPNFDIPIDKPGRIITDSFLQVQGYEDCIYALGDAATVPGDTEYFGTAQVAVQQADYAAWNAWASLTGKPRLEYRYAHLGEMMVLGARNAAVTTSVGLELEGTPAWAARRLAYLARMPTDRHRKRVAASWATNPLLSGMGDLVKESRKYRTNTI